MSHSSSWAKCPQQYVKKRQGAGLITYLYFQMARNHHLTRMACDPALIFEATTILSCSRHLYIPTVECTNGLPVAHRGIWHQRYIQISYGLNVYAETFLCELEAEYLQSHPYPVQVNPTVVLDPTSSKWNPQYRGIEVTTALCGPLSVAFTAFA